MPKKTKTKTNPDEAVSQAQITLGWTLENKLKVRHAEWATMTSEEARIRLIKLREAWEKVHGRSYF